MLFAVGCSSQDGPTDPSSGSQTISRSASHGPVNLTLSITPGSVQVGAQATVRIEVTAPRDVTVEVEDYRDRLLEGDRRFELGVRELGQSEAVPTDADRLAWNYDYEVSFYLAGTIEFPPARVTYVDASLTKNPEADGDPLVDEPFAVETESITIQAIDPSEAALDEAALHDIPVLDPVELRRPLGHWAWIVPIAIVAACGLFLLMRHRRKGAEERIVVVPAHEWAWRQIARLLADDLITQGQVKQFYYRVSDIVRGYIERRFSVSAPEMTTEEFLIASAGDVRFSEGHRQEMERFLRACDLVKYAKHVPESTEADRLLAAARSFIDQTRERSAMEQTYINRDAYESKGQAA